MDLVMKKFNFDVVFKNNNLNIKDIDVLNESVSNIHLSADQSKVNLMLEFVENGKTFSTIKKLKGLTHIEIYIGSGKKRILNHNLEWFVPNNLQIQTYFCKSSTDDLIYSIHVSNAKCL